MKNIIQNKSSHPSTQFIYQKHSIDQGFPGPLSQSETSDSTQKQNNIDTNANSEDYAQKRKDSLNTTHKEIFHKESQEPDSNSILQETKAWTPEDQKNPKPNLIFSYTPDRMSKYCKISITGSDRRNAPLPLPHTLSGKTLEFYDTTPPNINDIRYLRNIPDLRIKTRWNRFPPALVNTTHLTLLNTPVVPGSLRNLQKLDVQSKLVDSIPDSLTNLTQLYLNRSSVTKLPSSLINIRELHANQVKEIPPTFVNLETLQANSIKTLPATLRNLRYLNANSLVTLPPTLTNIMHLTANALEKIPETLINLEVIQAKSVSSIPETLIKLKQLDTKNATIIITPNNFPSLQYVVDRGWSNIHSDTRTLQNRNHTTYLYKNGRLYTKNSNDSWELARQNNGFKQWLKNTAIKITDNV